MGMHPGHWHMMMEEEETYKRKSSDKVLAGRLLRYVLRFKRRVILLISAALISTLLGLAPPVLFAMAVDRYITSLDTIGLALIGAAYALLSILSFTAQYAQNYLIEWMGNRLEYEIRVDMFRHLQKIPLDYYAEREVGSIVSRVTNDVEKIAEMVTSGVVGSIVDLVTLVGIVTIMLRMNVRLSLISFTVIPMIVTFLYFWGRKVRSVYRRTRMTIASVSAKIEESVSGMKEIQAYSREKATQSEFLRANISNMEANVEASRVMSAFWPAVGIFSALGQSLVLLFGGMAIMRGEVTIGTLFGLMSYIERFFMPIQDLSMFWNNVQSAMAAAERVFNLLDVEEEVEEKPGAIRLDRIEGRISFENVTFGYDPDRPVLKNITFTIEPKKTVALVGPTGAGKTTMANLIYRFYSPQEGRITIDGYDIRDLDLRSLRSQMAIVLQDPFLFTGTVKENIRYGRPWASDEEVIAAAKAVGAHEFIEALPEGYETDVRERGGRLSIGQRQLICLARALLADPRILIMDEATSSIDPYTELIIKKALEKVLKDRTSIVIAHRLSTVRNADVIVVLDEGRIVEMGTHDELLRRGGLYSTLYETQFIYQKPQELENEIQISMTQNSRK
ncbi:ABC transporter ATP-binding protein [Candidatus Bathyarchaeota archaeon]|nr:ABC transporter ATP-binding protein [Candidatus Bathyarchaeota archaeon]